MGARLDRLPATQFHRRLLWLIGTGLLVDGIDAYLTAGVAGALVKEGTASLQQVALLVSVTTLGLGAGGFLCGILADQLGRRPVMRWTLLVVIIGSLGAACAPSIPSLLCWRLVTALGLGGETILGYAMLGEFLPPGLRGRWLARLGLLSNLGMPLALLLGFLILPLPHGWRWMLAIPGIAAIPVLKARRNLSESPRWLVDRQRFAEAYAVLEEIERSAEGVARPPADAQPTDGGAGESPRAERASLEEPAARPLSISLLLRGPYRQRLFVGASICIATMSAVFGFVSWLPTFFAAEGRDIASSALFAGLISVGCPAGVLLGMLITDRFERKWSIVAGSLLAILTGACYASVHTTPLILLCGFLVVAAVYAAGTVGMIGYIPELFPTALRMSGVGLSYTVGRTVSIMMPFAIVPVFSASGQGGVISMVSVIILAQTLVVALLGPLTRGRSLEAI